MQVQMERPMLWEKVKLTQKSPLPNPITVRRTAIPVLKQAV
jgi:hypothetical protein